MLRPIVKDEFSIMRDILSTAHTRSPPSGFNSQDEGRVSVHVQGPGAHTYAKCFHPIRRRGLLSPPVVLDFLILNEPLTYRVYQDIF